MVMSPAFCGKVWGFCFFLPQWRVVDFLSKVNCADAKISMSSIRIRVHWGIHGGLLFLETPNERPRMYGWCSSTVVVAWGWLLSFRAL